MTLDHGILNVPLRKRGDINAALDRYKLDTARADKTKRKADRATLEGERAKAKAEVATWPHSRFESLGKRMGVSAWQARSRIDSMAHWEPAKVLAILAREGQS